MHLFIFCMLHILSVFLFGQGNPSVRLGWSLHMNIVNAFIVTDKVCFCSFIPPVRSLSSGQTINKVLCSTDLIFFIMNFCQSIK